jgi:8-oxo-dGTP diphosphatase
MIRRSVSIAIGGSDGRLLLVQRPPDDEELPDAWGLPAASLGPGESWEAASRRAAREKLGVEIEVGPELERGTTPRRGYTLEMRLFDARITAGEPAVPQPFPDVTQYADWRWGEVGDLRPAAERGSLCCRLCLEHARHGGGPA